MNMYIWIEASKYVKIGIHVRVIAYFILYCIYELVCKFVVRGSFYQYVDLTDYSYGRSKTHTTRVPDSKGASHCCVGECYHCN